MYLRNDSDAPCRLDGYPTLRMLTAGDRRIPSQTSTRPSYTIPPMKPHRVLLSRGQSATFFIGVTDETGYGTRRCPVSTRVAIALPSTQTTITIGMHLSAYGGSVEHLRCGEVSVSPLIAGRHPRP